jgi:HrpA-like RNA helicase
LRPPVYSGDIRHYISLCALQLKVVLMSATGEEACLLDYFRDFDPATVFVEGRCAPPP